MKLIKHAMQTYSVEISAGMAAASGPCTGVRARMSTAALAAETIWQPTCSPPRALKSVAVVTEHCRQCCLNLSLCRAPAGLGPSAGQAWRVGVMGYNARAEAVALVVNAFRTGLAEQGYNKK